MQILVLHGPNLDLLGRREPEVYGRLTLSEIDAAVRERAASLEVEVRTVQSNHEGELVDAVHQAHAQGFAGAVVNAAAYSHTSIALRDALLGVDLPFVEVHLSNIYAREPFRHRSVLADRAIGVVLGLGVASYTLGLEGLVARLRATQDDRSGGSDSG